MRNPWMSMYLSAANKALGTVRGKALAEAGRQRAAARKKATKQIAAFWTGRLSSPAAKKRRKPRR